MRFISLALSASFVSTTLAAIYDVQLYAESENSSVKGQALYSIHEGAGTNYFLLGPSPEVFHYDTEAHKLYNEKATYEFSISVEGQYLANSVSAAGKATSSDGKLSIDGTSAFYAAKNTSDPYNYSKEKYIVLVEEFPGAIPFTIKVVPVGDHSSEPPSSYPPSSSSGYTNTTSTTTLTYTEGRTTVVTITTCPATVTDCPARHTPVTITTVIPVTLTTTYCPATTTPTYIPYTPTTIAPVTVISSTTGKTPPSVTSVPNGAAKVGSFAGAAVVAAAGFFL